MTIGKLIVPAEVTRCVNEHLLDGTLGVMIYGSTARGTAGEFSDIDLLQLRAEPHRPYQCGKINISVYTPEFLSRIAASGSLFVLHLNQEGVVVCDPDFKIAACLDAYSAPLDYDDFRNDLREAAALLETNRRGYKKNWRAYNRVALFLLRSTLFSEFAESGTPCFSIPEIAEQRNDARLSELYEIKYAKSQNWKAFTRLSAVVTEYLGCTAENPYDSIESLILHNDQNELLVSLGYRLIGKHKPFDFYAAIRQQLASLRLGETSNLDPTTILARDTGL